MFTNDFFICCNIDENIIKIRSWMKKKLKIPWMRQWQPTFPAHNFWVAKDTARKQSMGDKEQMTSWKVKEKAYFWLTLQIFFYSHFQNTSIGIKYNNCRCVSIISCTFHSVNCELEIHRNNCLDEIDKWLINHLFNDDHTKGSYRTGQNVWDKPRPCNNIWC